jgi:hypothetical protein
MLMLLVGKKLFCSLGLDPIPWTLSKKLKFERSQLTSTLSAYIHGRKQTRICLWGKFSHFLFSCPKSSDRKTEGREREGQKDRKRDRERERERDRQRDRERDRDREDSFKVRKREFR